MNIIDFLKNSVNNYPEKISLIFENDSFTFNELWKSVEKFSSSLSSFDLQDVVSLMAENSSSFIIAYLGIINSAKIVHLIPPEISELNLLEQINSSNSSSIICSNNVFTKISKFSSIKIPILKFDKIIENTDSSIVKFKTNKIAYLIYTSGTTSIPKGVGITHSMVEFTTKNITNVLKYTPSDIDVLPLPLFHSFGLGCLHTSLFNGSTLILLKNTNDLQKILDTIKKYNATTLAAIPATLSKFLQFNKKNLMDSFSGIRLIITNSTKIPIITTQKFKKICINGNLATYYGLTEASRSTFMIFDDDSSHDESVGKPAPGIKIKIIYDDSEKSKIGEICIKGNNVIKKYWKNSSGDQTLIDDWLKTGDLGYFDDDGYLYLIGRTDDLINIGGEKVMPDEIENTIKQIPGVENVAAFGIDHAIFGQVIKLHIVKSQNSDLDKSFILNYCIKHLERYKVPTKIDFVTNIPQTDYGKVKRFMLK
jgi:long-chain acyl-CoA synthetase